MVGVIARHLLRRADGCDIHVMTWAGAWGLGLGGGGLLGGAMTNSEVEVANYDVPQQSSAKKRAV